MLQIRGEPIRAAAALLSLLLFSRFSLFCLGSCGWFTYSPHPLHPSKFFFFFFGTVTSSETQKHRFSKGLTLDSAASFCLSEQVRVCCSSTNRPSSPLIYLSCRFISSSRRRDWRAKDWATRVMSQRKERRGEERYCLSAASLAAKQHCAPPPVCATRADASGLCVW